MDISTNPLPGPDLAGTVTHVDPRDAARAARLRYVHDRQPGFKRHREGEKQFRILDHHGAEITDDADVERIRKLAIPPAYEDVWICRHPDGHLQATGRDARGRKQYRYHARWREVRDEGKYERMLVFGAVLPRIREQVAADLALSGLPKRRVLAAIVRLLEGTMMRVGNEEYARTNDSFGLTTLRPRHAMVKGAHLTFDFRGKHGVQHHIDLDDRRLANIVRRCQELTDQHLFHFVDHDGQTHPVTSDDVNAYLHEVSGVDVTAKDFRTWAATNLAALALGVLEPVEGSGNQKKAIVAAVESVAKKLGNTPAICRKCYIHPAIFDGYLDGTLAQGLRDHADGLLADSHAGLSPEERAVTAYLSHRLHHATEKRA